MSSHPKKKILIIDDEECVRDTIGLLLNKRNYNVKSVESGEKGLEALSKSAYDLVISDILMPKFTGLETLQAIATKHPEVPVIMLTGLVDYTVTEAARKRGAFAILEKPVKSKDLLAMVQQAMNVER